MRVHFPHRAIDGSWHAVYRQATTGDLISVVDCIAEQSAKDECQRLNTSERAKQIARDREARRSPYTHRIPAGFYTDQDAA